MKKVSIIDVAKHAGVSVSTVSLVLRQKGKISEATIEKVNAAINTWAMFITLPLPTSAPIPLI